ncbi:MAG: sensor histidine kinase [Porticoccaceae bacterium]
MCYCLSKLFDSFYTSGRSGGTGLGLAYCKRTMQALDGDIHCISELGKFTSFKLTFSNQQANLEIVRDVTKKI